MENEKVEECLNLPPKDALPEFGYLKAKRLIELFDISESHFYALIKSGDFPKPTRLSPQTTRWSVADLRTWLNEKNPTQKTKVI